MLKKKVKVNGILLLYNHPLYSYAPTVMEHIDIFKIYSRFPVWSINTEFGFPRYLDNLDFHIIILHYSLFGVAPYRIYKKFLNYLIHSNTSYKIAFFQDEYHFCQSRFAFIKEFKINKVYTLLEPNYFSKVYLKHTNTTTDFIYNLPGYVSEGLVEIADQLALPEEQRTIDVGYRGRRLPFYMGKGAQEKHYVASEFRKLSRNLDLQLDIETDETKRIYGENWYQFLANCRAVLGVEAGVSIFDTEDIVRQEYERLVSIQPNITFEEMSEKLLHKWEKNIPYRTISPRHFEAAALRVCQILFEGNYSGVMQPMVHYIPLKKDFSNFDEVIQRFKDKALRNELTENAYRDLIASGQYSYKKFIQDFDKELMKAGFQPDISQEDMESVTEMLNKGKAYRESRAKIKSLRYYNFPGRRQLKSLVKGLLRFNS